MGRWIRFFVAILLGVAAGLLYGWGLNPVSYVDTTPDSLRRDYQTDYVLMVAEAYQGEHDMGRALRRLGQLGDRPPTETAHQAVLFAQSQGWPDGDVAKLQALETALEAVAP